MAPIEHVLLRNAVGETYTAAPHELAAKLQQGWRRADAPVQAAPAAPADALAPADAPAATSTPTRRRRSPA